MKHWNNITFSTNVISLWNCMILGKVLGFFKGKGKLSLLKFNCRLWKPKSCLNVCRSIFRIIKSCGIIYKENLLFFWVQSESKGTNSVQLAQLTQFYVRQIHQEIFNKESCLKNSPTYCFSTKIEEDSV